MYWRRMFSTGDEEIDGEGAGCYLLLWAVVLFLVSTYFTWQEFRYAVFSKSAVAEVVGVEEVEVYRRRRRVPELVVTYQFTDESTKQPRTGTEHFSIDADIGSKEDVQYFPGKNGDSRLRRTARSWPIIVFFATIAFAGYSLWKMYLEANETTHRKKRRRKRKRRTA